MNLLIHDFENKEAGSYKVNDKISQVEIKQHLIHQTVVAEQAAQRQATRAVKTRGQVRGTGRKPWAQKGLGLARHGSKRSPIWIKGGVAHGPTTKDNFKLKTNKKVVHLAFVSAFNLRQNNDQISVIDNINIKAFSTKKVLVLLNSCEYKKSKRVLIVINPDEQNSEFLASINNLDNVICKKYNQVSTLDLMLHDRAIFTKAALKSMEDLIISWSCIK